MATERYTADVAIVGLGPAGATLANFLGQAGLSVSVFEREADIYPLPRAIHFDGEVMRIFQAIGLKDAINAIARPGLKGMHFVNADNKTLLVRGGTGLDGPHGCANNYYFHQPLLEQTLRLGLKRFEQVAIHLGHEVLDLTQHSDHCELVVMDQTSQAVQTHRARYVIGCDGAKSLVRRKINAKAVDLGLEQPWLVFDIVLKGELTSLPDHTVQICDPARPMTYCYVTQQRRRFEIMLMPGDERDHLLEPSTLWALVSQWVQPEEATIERATIYTFHSLIYQQWRDQRMMILGDSAHQTPPFLGQGMCACIRDASNLAWKLAMVIQHGCSDGLLDTYETERSPHVRSFIELAVKLGAIIQTTDPNSAKQRDVDLLASPDKVFEFPAPRLGHGFSAEGHPLVNAIFPQPRLSTGELMDERVDNRFVLICLNPEGLSAVRAGLFERAQILAIDHAWVFTLIGEDHPQIHEWMRLKDLAFVLLRPDRYIAGATTNSADMIANLLELEQTLLSS